MNEKGDDIRNTGGDSDKKHEAGLLIMIWEILWCFTMTQMDISHNVLGHTITLWWTC